MRCDEMQEQFALLLYGELSFQEEEIIQQHVDGCSVCREELARARKRNAALNEAELDVPAKLLQDCRRNLRVSVASIPAGRAARGGRWNWLSAWPGKTVAAAALIGAGFLGGILVSSPRDSIHPSYRVRSLEPLPSGRIRLVLEETRERVLSGDPGDQQIRELLLSAATEASDPGVRGETVDLLRSQSELPDVRSAFVTALRHDPSAGVRLKALDGLRRWASEPDTRKALAEVVRSDSNPGVRTQAIDLLVENREPETVGVLQELLTREQNDHVRLKCQKVLHAMNASAETF